MCPARTAALSLLATVAACGPGTTSKECSGVLPGDLVITEVFADAVGPDEGREWLELYNTSDRPIELEGATLTVTKADGSGAKSAQLEGITIAPGQYFTLGNAAPELTPPYIDYGYANALGDMPNSNGGQIALRCGDALIDEAKYDMVKGGHSRQLSAAVPPDYTRNDDLANWCEATESEFSDGAFGTPGQDNDCAPIIAGTCMDGGEMRAAVPPNPGELVITELMPTPRAVSATVGQWVEVMATVPLDLNGVGIDHTNDSDMSPETIDAATCVHLEAGEYAVFARNGDVGMNGGVMNTPSE